MTPEHAVRRRGVAALVTVAGGLVAAAVTAAAMVALDRVAEPEVARDAVLAPDPTVAAVLAAATVGLIALAAGGWWAWTWRAYRGVIRRSRMGMAQLAVWSSVTRADRVEKLSVHFAPNAGAGAGEPRVSYRAGLVPPGADEPICGLPLGSLEVERGRYDVAVMGELRPRRWIILVLADSVVLPARRTTRVPRRPPPPPLTGLLERSASSLRVGSGGPTGAAARVALAVVGLGGVAGGIVLATRTAPVLAAGLAAAGWLVVAVAAAPSLGAAPAVRPSSTPTT